MTQKPIGNLKEDIPHCIKCGSRSFFPEEEDEMVYAVCLQCGNRVSVRTTAKPKPVEPPIEQPLKPKKRIRGISAKESRRIYSKSPAGKAAWERYRRSELFYEAHARHRATETYAETQRRYKDKVKLFKKLLHSQETLIMEYTCPLKIFHKGPHGEVYNNQILCDRNGTGECKLGCTY